MTFSIVAHDPETGDLGVAVQSKFPNVGVSIPYAQAGVGAIATQCYCNTSFGPRGLALLGHGASPQQAVEILTGNDAEREFRQLGIVDVQGRAASFTGARCFDWAGSRHAPHVAVQGNVLAGAGVLDAMLERYLAGAGEPLPVRLVAALAAGQALAEAARQHFAPVLARRAVGLTLQVDVGNEVFDAAYAGLWKTFAEQDGVHRAVSILAPSLAVRSTSMAFSGADFPQHAHQNVTTLQIDSPSCISWPLTISSRLAGVFE